MDSATLVMQQVEAALEDASTCVMCSQEGMPAYVGLRDHTFGTTGEWTYLKCRRCGLLWLSPRPFVANMGKFYTTYLTHGEKRDHLTARRLNEKFKLALYARTLRKPELSPNFLWAKVAQMLSFDPFVRELGNMGTMYLGRIKPGRVLDVGCGNGSFLALMQAAGWEVAGLETDCKAAKLAAERLRTPIQSGDLCQVGYPEASFDAVTLHHVIEHVHNPITVMAECRRILKPNGTLTIVTPNNSSLGHRLFSADWRGLEPPRHIHVFNRKALSACASKAGFRVRVLRTSARMAPGMWMESTMISKRSRGVLGKASLLSGLAFVFWERLMNHCTKEAGEEIVLVGTPA